MNERRKHRRFTAPEPLAVKESGTRLTLGFLQDISHNGLMLRGKCPFRIGATYHLKIILPKSISGSRSIEIEAVCKWVSQSNLKKAYDAGFEFTPLPTEKEIVIRLLEADYAISALPSEIPA